METIWVRVDWIEASGVVEVTIEVNRVKVWKRLPNGTPKCGEAYETLACGLVGCKGMREHMLSGCVGV